MNPKAIALALRAAADNLERARQLVQDLPASAVDEMSAFALAFDSPRVILALATIAGTLDPEGDTAAEEEELVGELPSLLLPRRVQP